MKRILGLISIAGLLVLYVGQSASAQQGNGNGPTRGCDQALENDGDPYDSTCDGSPSENGNGGGNATGKPCAGCVGAADNKNPQGQLPDGSDHNAGYECDRNSGVGKTNPAHTGCDAYTGKAPAIEAQTIEASNAVDAVEPAEEGSITRGSVLLVALAGLASMGTLSVAIRRRVRRNAD